MDGTENGLNLFRAPSRNKSVELVTPWSLQNIGRMSVMVSTFSNIGFMHIFFKRISFPSRRLSHLKALRKRKLYISAVGLTIFFLMFFCRLTFRFHFRRKSRGLSIRFRDSEFSDFKNTPIHSTVTKTYFWRIVVHNLKQLFF